MSKARGKCYCSKSNMMISKKRFPPSPLLSQIPETCAYFRDKRGN
jgi:hypothetical protein